MDATILCTHSGIVYTTRQQPTVYSHMGGRGEVNTAPNITAPSRVNDTREPRLSSLLTTTTTHAHPLWDSFLLFKLSPPFLQKYPILIYSPYCFSAFDFSVFLLFPKNETPVTKDKKVGWGWRAEKIRGTEEGEGEDKSKGGDKKKVGSGGEERTEERGYMKW